jgi:hypothetical protein
MILGSKGRKQFESFPKKPIFTNETRNSIITTTITNKTKQKTFFIHIIQIIIFN